MIWKNIFKRSKTAKNGTTVTNLSKWSILSAIYLCNISLTYVCFLFAFVHVMSANVSFLGNSDHRNNESSKTFYRERDERLWCRVHAAGDRAHHTQCDRPFFFSLCEPCYSLVRVPCSHSLLVTYYLHIFVRFPPMPAPLLWAVRVWFSRKYAAAWKFGPCDIHKKLKEHIDWVPYAWLCTRVASWMVGISNY